MNLWSIDIEKLTWDQLLEFLKQGEIETVRLDFKQALDDSVKKTICAFANTLGGIIVVGLEEDKVNNTCIFPSIDTSRLEPMRNSIKDSVFQASATKIYPPVSVQVSPIFENPKDNTKAIYVIRVDQSAHAPHAYEKNRVLVAERKDNMTVNHDVLADIDVVQALFERRNRIEEKREQLIEQELNRTNGQFSHRSSRCAKRWISIIPWFPDRHLVDRNACFKVLQSYKLFPLRRQNPFTFPNGAYAQFSTNELLDGTIRLTDYGHLHVSEVCPEVIEHWHHVVNNLNDEQSNQAQVDYHMYLQGQRKGYPLPIDFYYMHELFYKVVVIYRELFKNPVELPTLLEVTIGLQCVKDYQVSVGKQVQSTTRLIDDEYRESIVCNLNELLENADDVLARLGSNLMYGCSLSSIYGGFDGYKSYMKERWQHALKHFKPIQSQN